MRILSFIFCFFFSFVFSQKGSLKGVVYDGGMDGQPLPFANVFIKGTNLGVTTDFDGNYVFEAIDNGVHTISFSFIGYKTLRKEGVQIIGGQEQILNMTLEPDSMSLNEVVVSTISRKETEEALLVEQKNIVQIKTAIGANEITRKGVNNVSDAVTNISSISKQTGSSNIYVRGLGDRYNITTLNGLPMPSDDPRRKNPSLSLFSTNIVESISVSKIYDPMNYGDFSGANINIISRNYSGSPFIKVRLSTGFNSNAIKESDFRLQSSIPENNFGFAKPIFNDNKNNDALKNYNLDSWNTRKVNLPTNFGLMLTGGNSFSIGTTKLNVFLVGAHRSNFNSNSGLLRGSVNAQGLIKTNYKSFNFGYNTNTTLMGNFSFVINQNHNIRYNTLFINSSNQDHNEYTGTIDIDFTDNDEDGGAFVRRSALDRTTMLINQLLGKHMFAENIDLDWRVGYNMANNNLNRLQNMMLPYNNNMINNEKRFLLTNESSSNRFFQHLNEDEFSTRISTNYQFIPDEKDNTFKGKLTLGYSTRFKVLNYNLTQFNFAINENVSQPIVNINNFDDYFNKTNFDNSLFSIKTFRGDVDNPEALSPNSYSGNQLINAFIGSLQYKLSSKFQIILGLRTEIITQNLKWLAILDTGEGNSNYTPPTQFLPAVSGKYSLNDKQNIKFGFSKTYTLPQFKERSPFPFDVLTNQELGNPDLSISTNYNTDIKWEWFPSIGELVSLGIFSKYIFNPISQTTIASASNDVSYVNSGDLATIIGLEIELRKKLISFGKQNGLNQDIKLGTNFSYMNTKQELSNEKVNKETSLSTFFTDKSSRLTGASDMLLNFDISYLNEFTKDKNIILTAYYSYFSDRIFALGNANKGNQVDKGFGTLNFTATSELSKSITMRLNFGNLLNPKVERIQENKTGNVLLGSYKAGINTSIRISYRF